LLNITQLVYELAERRAIFKHLVAFVTFVYPFAQYAFVHHAFDTRMDRRKRRDGNTGRELHDSCTPLATPLLGNRTKNGYVHAVQPELMGYGKRVI